MTRRNLFLRTIGAALAAMLPRKPRAFSRKEVWEYEDVEGNVSLGTTLAAEQITESVRCFRARS